MPLKLDDTILASVQDHLWVFEHVHPNYITLTGIAINLACPYLYFSGQILILNVLLIVRFFADVLDGAVARKFKKSSTIGGALDSLCDTSLIFIYSYIMAFRLLDDNTYALVASAMFGGMQTYGLVALGAVTDHTALHSSMGNAEGQGALAIAAQRLADNSILLFIFMIAFNIFL